MVSGASGVHGMFVLLLATKEYKQDQEHVLFRHLLLQESNVLAVQINRGNAHLDHVQVMTRYMMAKICTASDLIKLLSDFIQILLTSFNCFLNLFNNFLTLLNSFLNLFNSFLSLFNNVLV